MPLLSYRPGPPLADFVELLWFCDDPPPAHAKERLLPTGTVELVINLRTEVLGYYDRHKPEQLRNFRGPLVCGPHSEFFVIDTADQDAVIGVHFKPGGAYPFLGLPAGELHNAHAPLEQLWGYEALRLRDRLVEAKTPAARFRILEHTLVAQAYRRLVPHRAVALALDEFQRVPQLLTVAGVTERLGLSPRQLIRLFGEQVGLTPKLFCRVQRFQQVLRLVKGHNSVPWADVALSCGYYDQAHFINDFQAFSGLNPTAYLRERTAHLNHVPYAG
jgi:AraC-like DNA-binding protein